MSCSRCLSLSALLASTFIMPTAAMDLTSAPLNGFPTHTHLFRNLRLLPIPIKPPPSVSSGSANVAKTSPSAKATALMSEIPPTCAGKKDTP